MELLFGKVVRAEIAGTMTVTMRASKRQLSRQKSRVRAPSSPQDSDLWMIGRMGNGEIELLLSHLSYGG